MDKEIDDVTDEYDIPVGPPPPNESGTVKVVLRKRDDSGSPICPSCGVPYERHLGLNGTCKKLQKSLSLSARKKTMSRQKRDIKELRELLKAVYDYLEAEMVHQHPDAPGHSHRDPGRWDTDGSLCEWCATWSRVRERIQKTGGSGMGKMRVES